jgi:hypothetical protein
MLCCPSAYAACSRDASGKATCNGQRPSGNARQSWKNSHQEENSFAVTTSHTNRGGELKTKNGRAIYKSPNGKDCYKTERWVAFELRRQKTIPVYFSGQANSIRSQDIAANGSSFGGLQFIGTKLIGRVDEVRWELIRISRHPNTQYEFLLKSGFCIAAASVCHAPGNTQSPLGTTRGASPSH